MEDAERGAGVVTRLSDVAEVVLGAENYDTEVRFGGQTATFMGLWVLPTESTVEVIKRVREALPDIERALPVGLKARIGYDASKYIDEETRKQIFIPQNLVSADMYNSGLNNTGA